MDDVTLTDDEVVALGAIRGAAWPGGAPTVGPDEVGEAAFRGNRSLFVRGFKDGEAMRDLDQLADEVFGERAKVVVYLGDDDLRVASRGFASVVHPAEGHALIERVDAIGLHRLVRVSDADALAYVRALLDGALQAGPEDGASDDGGPRVLCAVAVAGRSGLVTVARRGSVEIGPASIEEDGTPVAGELAATDPEAAARELLTSLRAVSGSRAPVEVTP